MENRMIKLIKPYITFDEVKEEFKEIFDSGMLTRGKSVSYTHLRYAAVFQSDRRA